MRTSLRRAWLGLAMALQICLAGDFACLAEDFAKAQAIDEYQLKGAFLFNFAKFVDWPSGTFRSGSDPIVGCILGESPFGHGLEQAVDGKRIEARSFIVRRVNDVHQTAGCQILFVSSSEHKRVREILAEVGHSGILTVGYTSGFALDGGVADFTIEHGKVRIEINLEAAENQKLRIHARLLSLAEIVRSRALANVSPQEGR